MVTNEDAEAETLTDRRQARAVLLGQRLRERIDELGLSGASVARRTRISARLFNYYLRGERPLDVIVAKRIASVLGITLDDLVDPADVLNHRDDRTHRALHRFYEICGDLDPDDIGILADIAEVTASRRQEEAKTYFGEGIPPFCERLMRVHRLLVPPILKRFAVRRFETAVIPRHDGKLWIQIGLVFGSHAERGKIAEEMMAMATQHLCVKPDEVRRVPTLENVVGIEVCLGPDPEQQARPAQVRHRARRSRIRPQG